MSFRLSARARRLRTTVERPPSRDPGEPFLVGGEQCVLREFDAIPLNNESTTLVGQLVYVNAAEAAQLDAAIASGLHQAWANDRWPERQIDLRFRDGSEWSTQPHENGDPSLIRRFAPS
jgi:hypothetical protein